MHSRRYAGGPFHGPRHHHHHPHSHRMGFRGRGGSRARRGDVRAAVLALLAEEPMHGYEMIKEIEERSGGVWKPSAGSIYPTLQLLEDEGLIAGEEVDGKRRFTLTADGRKVAEERGEAGAAPWEQVRSGTPPELYRLAQSMRQLNEAIAQTLKAGSEQQQARVRDLLEETRRKIYGILAEADA